MKGLTLVVIVFAGCGSHAAPIGNGGSASGSNAGSGDGRGDHASSPACAAAFAAVAAGQACDAVDARCEYPEGACFCGPRSYCGGAAPTQEILEALRQPVWQCTPVRTDGCPETPPSGACAEAGKQCGYGDCCAQVTTCTNGSWVAGPPQCPP
ncbi:MAG: hypothetical protein K8W52_27135 [Deltaproteobacteria bacterium]|nr:hypothetical protein [Deltaproteobacteria bacterium]